MCVYKVKRVGSWNVKIQGRAENKHLYLTGIKIYMYKLLSKALFVLGGITFNFTYEPSRFFFLIDGFCTEVIIKSVCMQPPSESYCVLFSHLLYLVFVFLYKSSSVFLI